MTMTLSSTQASSLYGILDEQVGVFREETMSSGAARFYEQKRDEFLETFTTAVPDVYWFQGFALPSVNLRHDSVLGFHITVDHADRQTSGLLEEVNALLRAENFDSEATSTEAVPLVAAH